MQRNPNIHHVMWVVAERSRHQAYEPLHGGAGSCQQQDGERDLSGDQAIVGSAAAYGSCEAAGS